MKTYLIRRPKAWKNAQELEMTAAKSARVGNEEMPDKVRWIRSYVVQEEDGTLGTLCVYQGTDEDAIQEHAERVGMPAEDLLTVVNTVVIREDPKPAEEAA